MKTYVIDTETGGTSPYTDGLASIHIKELDTQNEKTRYVKPKSGKFYSYRALQINKLSFKFLEENGSPLTSVMDDITINEFAEKAVKIIGHNIEFDLKFLISAAKEAKVKLPIIYHICTMELAKKHLKDTKRIKSIKLTEVYEYFFGRDDVIEDAHNASSDCLMTEAIYHKLMELENETEINSVPSM